MSIHPILLPYSPPFILTLLLFFLPSPQAAADKAKAQVEEQKKKAREAADKAEKEANRIADKAKQAKADLKASAKKAEKSVDEGIEKARGLFGGLKDFLK